MRITLSMIGVLAALSACATPQQTPEQASAPAATTATPGTLASAKDPDRIICKSQQITGTRLGAKRTCMKAREWDEFEYQQMKNTQGYQRNAPPDVVPGHP
ncbi:MAG TPA: hypothetical protein VEH07_00835 [Alphaproteobacteria bacterium]|nr:hypothetical protein [Alphaproteobacteria bacterium]